MSPCISASESRPVSDSSASVPKELPTSCARSSSASDSSGAYLSPPYLLPQHTHELSAGNHWNRRWPRTAEAAVKSRSNGLCQARNATIAGSASRRCVALSTGDLGEGRQRVCRNPFTAGASISQTLGTSRRFPHAFASGRLRLHYVNAMWSDAVDLHDRVAVRPAPMRRIRGNIQNTAGAHRLRARTPHVGPPFEHESTVYDGKDLVGSVIMRGKR